MAEVQYCCPGFCYTNKWWNLISPAATYQKITPVTVPPGSRDGGSSYTVTLFIRDQLSEAEPASTGPDPAPATSWTQGPLTDSPQGRSYASLPRPRNKSVFKKFFGKRE